MDPLELEHFCEAFPLDIPTASVSENPLISPTDRFFNIKAECTNLYILNYSNLVAQSATKNHFFSNIPKDSIVQETNKMLSQMGVPQNAHSFMAAKILACATTMANTTHKNHKILSMCVVIFISYDFNDDSDSGNRDDNDSDSNSDYDDDDSDDIEDEDDDDDDNDLVPATKSSIEGPEMVEEGSVMGRSCAICLEEFKVGSEAVRMPCLHLYHRVCIVNWLQKACSCPLCRFQMPIDWACLGY